MADQVGNIIGKFLIFVSYSIHLLKLFLPTKLQFFTLKSWGAKTIWRELRSLTALLCRLYVRKALLLFFMIFFVYIKTIAVYRGLVSGLHFSWVQRRHGWIVHSYGLRWSYVFTAGRWLAIPRATVSLHLSTCSECWGYMQRETVYFK